MTMNSNVPTARQRVEIALLVLTLSSLATGSVFGQLDYDRPPILYSTAEVHDPVARLQTRLDRGEAKLEFDGPGGYLKSLLKELAVPESSQMLVFSKTSFQQRLISPRTPRALYFNDDVYVGFVQNGDVLELSSMDPQQGAIFYTLRQDDDGSPRFVRDRGNCLTCHASSRTQEVPGHVVRSVYPSLSGLPHFGSGTFRTNHTSPLSQRWGGWYVTGTHGKQRHMGNVVSRDRDRPEILDVEAGANRATLEDLFDTDPYLTGHSDIVALMVLEHQTEMHNRITHAGFSARIALQQSASMNEILERPADYLSESTERRLDNAAEKVVGYLLFQEEAELTDPIRGTSGFAEEFAARGPFDRQGRSLRQFDLRRRLFKHPCSYLIYSAEFDALPPPIKDRVHRRLWEVLTGQDSSDEFAHLAASDRRAILEILRDTKKELPEYWRSDT
ncbi:MAG: hypothetical protein RIC55_34790 [Pirellulaceae bacterium]